MMLSKLLFLTYVLLSTFIFAQNKQITVEALWDGTFSTRGIPSLHSMNDGKRYATYNSNRSNQSVSVDVYEYSTNTKTETVLSTQSNSDLPDFSDYQFSPDESKLLLSTEMESIYRRSAKGIFYVVDVGGDNLIQISDHRIQEPTFSPDATKVAYGYENNLFVFDLSTLTTKQITFDGEPNAIINGITDWVYEEEFSFVRAFEWNSDGSQIAYIRFDERAVPEFSMDVYGTSLYPQQQVFKYPKAGESNSIVSLHVYHLAQGNSEEIRLPELYEDFYIPRIRWTQKASVLSAQFMNRHQNKLDLWLIDSTSKSAQLVLSETDEAYIDVTFDLKFLQDNSFIWTSEKDGYNHVYHYSEKGKLIKQITSGNWDVTELYGVDPINETLYYQSVETGSINRAVFRIDLDGRNKKLLTNPTGTNNAKFSADFTYFINTYSDNKTPPVYTLNDSKSGTALRTIRDNQSLIDRLKEYNLAEKEFGTMLVNGHEVNMYMIKPTDFDPSRSYPLLMYQYSGPGSQNVSDQWNSTNDYWHQMLAQQGYIVACIDGIGTGYKGAKFKKATYLDLVHLETEDQIEAARQLGQRSYIDASRIGIWGWSFGGHISTNSLLKGNDVFKMGIAVAPVTSWRFYDTIYTERYLRTPQENPKGYDSNSPVNYPELLKGSFLLVHGSADDNVHLQNSTRMARALILENKPFDWAIYPDYDHGIYGGKTRLHLFTKLTKFIKSNL